jgi:hypothetical protein
MTRDVEGAMERLRAAERERRAAIEELIRLGYVRSHVLVGDLGERLAAEYYGVVLADVFTPGHDLVDRDGRRIDVKTLRAAPEGPRTIIGAFKEPCDALLAIRLHYDYTMHEALEIPADVAREHTGRNGKVSWTQRLAADARVRYISATEFLAP